MSIYKHIDYKILLKNSLETKKSSLGRAFTYESMAKACRIQKTYLSRVLNRDGDLSRDQLYRACEFLGFSAAEKEFVFLVYDGQTTQIPELKKTFRNRIHEIQEKQKLTENNIEVRTNHSEQSELAKYYLDPHFQIIHMFLTIKKFAQEPALIAKELNMSEKSLSSYLEYLSRLKIIEYRQQQWIVKQDNLHLSKSSDLYKAYRSLMRIKALEQMDRAEEDDFYSFSVIFSTDPATQAKIKDEFLQFLKRTKALAALGKDESVYQINFDLLNWTRSEKSNGQ